MKKLFINAAIINASGRVRGGVEVDCASGRFGRVLDEAGVREIVAGMSAGAGGGGSAGTGGLNGARGADFCADFVDFADGGVYGESRTYNNVRQNGANSNLTNENCATAPSLRASSERPGAKPGAQASERGNSQSQSGAKNGGQNGANSNLACDNGDNGGDNGADCADFSGANGLPRAASRARNDEQGANSNLNEVGAKNGGQNGTNSNLNKVAARAARAPRSLGAFDEYADVIDCGGALLVPGLIDLHVHFRDPGLEYKDDIESGSRCAVAGGVTTCACMANTNPTNDNAQVARYIVQRAREVGLIDLHPIGAITRGLKGDAVVEMGDMCAAGCVAFSDDGRNVASSDVMRYALEYAAFHGSFVISHSQDCSLCAGGHMHEGAVSMRLGVRGMPREQEEIAVARDMLLAKMTGAHIHIAHVSSAHSLALVRQGRAAGAHITCEVAPHHFTFTDADVGEYDTNFKMSPPLREASDVAAIKAALANGEIDVIATDHAPHHLDEKFREFDRAPFGVLGLQTLVPLALNLVREGVISLEQFVALTSTNPARLLGAAGAGKGAVAQGWLADFALICPDEEWVFDERTNLSKSQNSPCWGRTLRGRVSATFRRGERVF